MWISRDFSVKRAGEGALPIKVLKGPRQVGKTALLKTHTDHSIVYLDDTATRVSAEENPRFFLNNLPKRVIIDEAALAPRLFPELKRRIDEVRMSGSSSDISDISIWLTGSNQTLMQKNVQESLAGRASYFDLNTLSIHELGDLWSYSGYLLRGGWPELYVSPNLDPVRYLNDLISTFIEHDIVGSAGIERRASFMKALNLVAARVGQLFNASDIGVNVGADATTIQSWLSLMEMNGIVFKVPPYVTNINKRLTKTPKYFFFDVALAVRMQGWTNIVQLLMSPLAGQLFENMVCGELLRFFINSAQTPQISFARSKEKVEVDFLIDLGNMRYLAIEAKTTPCSYTTKQHALLDSLEINIIDRWIVSPTPAPDFPRCRVVVINELWNALMPMMM